MKITNQHFSELDTRLQPAIKSFPHSLGEYKKSGMSHRRYCFDVLWHAKQSDFVCNTLYRYMNDDHLYTALKQIIKE